MTRLELAIIFAKGAHYGQTRSSWKDDVVEGSGGFGRRVTHIAKEDYINHPLRVMDKMETESEKIVAILHDVCEDCGIRVDDVWILCKMTAEEAMALALLTHKKKMPYEDYIKDIKSNKIATKIKLADLEDNLSTLDQSTFTEEKKQKLCERYEWALAYLKGE